LFDDLSKTVTGTSNAGKKVDDNMLDFKDITKKIGFKRKGNDLEKIENSIPPDVAKASQPKKTKKVN
jgi:hypothetical protein